MSLAVRLRELRLRSDQSLQQVANSVGASKAHIWELETGKSKNPSLDLLKRIAKHFKVTIANLVGETLDNVPDSVIAMHRELEGLTEGDRTVVKNVMADLKQLRKKEETQ